MSVKFECLLTLTSIDFSFPLIQVWLFNIMHQSFGNYWFTELYRSYKCWHTIINIKSKEKNRRIFVIVSLLSSKKFLTNGNLLGILLIFSWILSLATNTFIWVSWSDRLTIFKKMSTNTQLRIRAIVKENNQVFAHISFFSVHCFIFFSWFLHLHIIVSLHLE